MKYFGKIGFSISYEKPDDPGICVEEYVEKPYYGDILRNARRNDSTESKIIDDVVCTNRFSVIADEFAKVHLGRMRYITFAGTKWKITDVEIRYPRVIISIGGEYNE